MKHDLFFFGEKGISFSSDMFSVSKLVFGGFGVWIAWKISAFERSFCVKTPESLAALYR